MGGDGFKPDGDQSNGSTVSPQSEQVRDFFRRSREVVAASSM